MEGIDRSSPKKPHFTPSQSCSQGAGHRLSGWKRWWLMAWAKTALPIEMRNADAEYSTVQVERAVKMLDFEVKKDMKSKFSFKWMFCGALLSRHKCIKSYQIQHYLNQDKIFVSLKISFLFSWAEIIMDGETVGRWILEVGNRLFEEVGSTLCQMSKGCIFWMFRKWYAPDSRWEQLSIDSIGLYKSYILYI